MNARPSRGTAQRSHAELAADPRFSEYYDAVDRNPDLLVQETGVEGFQSFRGDAALVHGEERDSHTGAIHQYVQRSDPNGSGTYDVKWEQTGRGRLAVTDVRRTHD